jgi:hypothetical protein
MHLTKSDILGPLLLVLVLVVLLFVLISFGASGLSA